MRDVKNQDARIPVPGRQIASRIIKGRALLLDPDRDELQRLNDVGSFVWSMILERRHSVAEIDAAVVESFEVDAQTAAADVQAFLEELEQRGLIAWRDGGAR